MLVALGLAMGVLTFFYWRATRPSRAAASTDVAAPAGPPGDGTTGPVGPLDAMVADALRPDPFVTRDDLGLA